MTKSSKKFYKYAGLVLLLTEILKQFCLTFYINKGSYSFWNFPFQLCSIPMYACLAIGFTKSKTVENLCASFLMDYGLLAGIFAFCDTSGMHYIFFPLTLHSYLWHMFMIFLGFYSAFLYINSSEAERMSWGFLRSSSLFLFCCLLATIINIVLHPYGLINMFYISPYYKMTQVVFIQIAGIIGDFPAKLLYIGCIVLGAGIIHKLFSLLKEKHKSL